ncbi:zinc-ribbon domain containing protein [Chloroflexota bacterium]
MRNDITNLVNNKSLICVECGCEFIFTIGEQRYYLSKGLSTPKRCSQCRLRRKLSLVPEGRDQ